MSQVLWTPIAKDDLIEIGLYIAEDSEDSAFGMMDTIQEKCRILSENPAMGRTREELAPSIRSFPVEAYLIFYQALKDGVEVIRILHSARDIENIFEIQ